MLYLHFNELHVITNVCAVVVAAFAVFAGGSPLQFMGKWNRSSGGTKVKAAKGTLPLWLRFEKEEKRNDFVSVGKETFKNPLNIIRVLKKVLNG